MGTGAANGVGINAAALSSHIDAGHEAEAAAPTPVAIVSGQPSIVVTAAAIVTVVRSKEFCSVPDEFLVLKIPPLISNVQFR
jgi:hypothetical protein